MTIKFTFDQSATSKVQAKRSCPDFGGVSFDLLENAGFDAVVIDADPAVAASGIQASNLQAVIEDHAGSLSPVDAARLFGTLSLRLNGKLALRVDVQENAGSRKEDRMPDHAAAWRRADEYLTLLKRLWTNDRPFDHEGQFYSVAGGFVPKKSRNGISIPIRLRGLSGTALKTAGRHADVLELPVCTPEEARLFMNRARAAAAECGRQGKLSFALPIRLADMPEPALDRSLLAIGGTPGQVAVALLGYIEAGVSEFIVGATHQRDLLWSFGHHIIPLVQKSIERRAALWHAPGSREQDRRGIETDPVNHLAEFKRMSAGLW